MFGAAGLTDEVVQAAVAGSQPDLARLAEALQGQVRVMVLARLSPTPAQFHVVEDLTQEVMVQLVTGIGRLEKATVRGLVAFLAAIVRHVVCRYFSRGIAGSRLGPVVRSLDSTVSGLSEAAPLWQFLSQSGRSPPSAAARSEQIAHVLTELGKLKPQHREVITMALFDQRLPSETAVELGISPAAASMLFIRAVNALRRHLTQPPENGQEHDHTAG
jgi:RNA polymerase sigma factor (sigma-70 family)